MGQSKKLGMTGTQTLQVWETSLKLFYYKYGRRLIMFSVLVIGAFFIGWFLHREGYFPQIR